MHALTKLDPSVSPNVLTELNDLAPNACSSNTKTPKVKPDLLAGLANCRALVGGVVHRLEE
jgi:hypothetical protein